MKRKDKIHELDETIERIIENKNLFNKVYIFGTGLIGTDIMKIMCAYSILEGFIDNDVKKQKSGYKGYKVYSLEEYMKFSDGIIIVAVNMLNRESIIGQLENWKLKEGENFFLCENFLNDVFPIVSLYLFQRSFVSLAQISLTERCTLKCQKCAHGCFAVNYMDTKDLSLEQVYESADSFFVKFDYVYEFVLIGGEPLLYQQLAEAIQYIGEHYRRQIGILSITTNGTLSPDRETMNKCRKYNVLFRISNYSKSIPGLIDKYKQLTDTLDHNDIQYVLSRDDAEWYDYGFDHLIRNSGPDELIKVFDSCKTPCREVRENKFYFCVMARSVAENMSFDAGENDYLDLDALNGKDYKRELLEFNLGYSEKGYLDMCNFCYGVDAKKHPVPMAEQMKMVNGDTLNEQFKL